jgi:hypothetical protein
MRRLGIHPHHRSYRFAHHWHRSIPPDTEQPFRSWDGRRRLFSGWHPTAQCGRVSPVAMQKRTRKDTEENHATPRAAHERPMELHRLNFVGAVVLVAVVILTAMAQT